MGKPEDSSTSGQGSEHRGDIWVPRCCCTTRLHHELLQSTFLKDDAYSLIFTHMYSHPSGFHAEYTWKHFKPVSWSGVTAATLSWKSFYTGSRGSWENVWFEPKMRHSSYPPKQKCKQLSGKKYFSMSSTQKIGDFSTSLFRVWCQQKIVISCLRQTKWLCKLV